MSDINSVTVVGRVVEKPELKFGQSGNAVTNIRIANNVYQGQGKDEKVNWFTVVAFGKQAENCEKLLDKGKQIVVDGRLDWSSWETKEGDKRSKVQIVANSIQFVGGGKQNGQSENSEGREVKQDEMGNDIPF